MIAIIMAIIVSILLGCISKDVWKKGKEAKKGMYILILIFIVTTTLVYIILRNTNYFKKIFEESNIVLYEATALAIFSMSISIIIDIIISKIVQKIYEIIIIKKNEDKAYNKEYIYYREILSNVSPGIISYCYNRNSNIQDEIVAIVLNLKLHNRVKINNNHIEIIDDNLSSHEKYVIKSINNKKINNKYFKKVYSKLLLQDLKKQGYIEIVDKNRINVVEIMELFMVWLIIYMIITIPVFFSILYNPIFIIIGYVLSFIAIPAYKKIEGKINPTVRTKKALELKAKLKGLKKYMLDYSNIKDTTIENINFFDEYVIYAIILNLKGLLNEESKKMYNDMYEVK